MRILSAGVTGFGLAVGIFLFALHAQETPKSQSSVWDGVYTAEQASHGRSLYNNTCSPCHGSDLAGAEVGPPVAGPQFLSKWNGQSVGALFTKIQDTMPAGNPGGLSRDVNRDILAYLLSVNGFPAGKTELPQQNDQLSQIRMDSSKPGTQ